MKNLQQKTIHKLIAFDILFSLVTLGLFYGVVYLVRLMRDKGFLIGGSHFLNYFLYHLDYTVMLIMLGIFFALLHRMVQERSVTKKIVKINAVIFLAINAIAYFVVSHLAPNTVYQIEAGANLMVLSVGIFACSFILLPLFVPKS